MEGLGIQPIRSSDPAPLHICLHTKDCAVKATDRDTFPEIFKISVETTEKSLHYKEFDPVY